MHENLTPEENISEAEKLELIHQMINSARDEHSENGLGWIVWGIILFVASLGTYFMLEYQLKGSFWLWNIVFPIGLVLIFISVIRRKKRQHKRSLTYAQELLERMGIGFFASLLAMIAGINLYFMTSNGTSDIEFWGFFYIIYAFWMYIHGSALKFRPLIIGAVLNWIAGVAMFVIAEMKYEMLTGAIAILLGYLVPGYLLFVQSKKLKS
ncbi:hypothetical protein [Flavihumibacter fluvii]|uniref:hypothetical protein n=1 Tax=Flavihumibacter fluvii TaxID=2838157 RepID=UPI001BDE2EC3|nr:hypothetical protein [Flavihumibacter fluvii]ULQ52515.1 hypothetical protein KJS93_20715 [Flavihumibacter fluvii]